MAQLELRKASRADESELNPKIIIDYPDEDFIPFVCHFDHNTILTKNGELLKVIKISGGNNETAIAEELVSLREIVRDSIAKHIKSDEFALWIHTIRRKKDLVVESKFPDYFSQIVNQAWEDQNNWKKQFINELYLTIIIGGYDTSIINFNSFLRSLSPISTRNLHKNELQKSYQNLTSVADKILAELNSYGAHFLGVVEKDGILYSEPMHFFGKITNLGDKDYPLLPNDMASDLSNYKIAFGNRSLEVVDGGANKNFAAMFSIKEYREVSVGSLDKVLQLPQEFIITQSFDFIDRNKALIGFDYQNYILDVSGDEQLKYLSELETIIGSDSGSATDYGRQQITAMLINETINDLQKDIDGFLNKLHELGLVVVREDIFSEHCFWSQLPGNFKFLRRQKVINVARLAGFASLHNFLTAKGQENYWGDIVTIFRTILGSPYFFNFHIENNGHSLIIGPIASGKTILLNFLLAQSRKFNNKIYYFDHNDSARIFVEVLGGNYFKFTRKDNKGALKLAPLSLVNNAQSRNFLINWFSYLIHYGKEKLPEEELNLIPQIIDKIIAEKIVKLSDAVKFFNTEATKNIYHKLAIWYGDGKYAFIFDNNEENDWSDNLVNVFDLTLAIENKVLLVPIITYLLHKIEISLDGNSKTIIAIDRAWQLLDNYAITPIMDDWLKRLKSKNTLVIFCDRGSDEFEKRKITKIINKNVINKFFLPDHKAGNYYKTIFGLNDNEFQALDVISSAARYFLLKHGEDSVIANLNLTNIPEVMAILSANKKSIEAMKAAQKEVGDDSQEWLQKFLEIMGY